MTIRPRPPIKTKLINFRVSEMDYEILSRLAKDHNLSISDFLRARAGLPVRYRPPKKGKRPKPAPLLPATATISPSPDLPPSPEPEKAPEPPADLSLVSILHRR